MPQGSAALVNGIYAETGNLAKILSVLMINTGKCMTWNLCASSECSSERGDKSPPPPPPGFVPGVLVESEKGTIPNEGDVYEESLDQEEDKKIKDGEMLSSGLYTRENMETPPIPVLLMAAERTIIEEPYKSGKQSSAQSVRAGRESALSTRSNKVGVAGSADSVS